MLSGSAPVNTWSPGVGGVLLTMLMVLALSACGRIQVQSAGAPIVQPVLADDHARMADGYRLPLHRWEPREVSEAVILGVHGFGDYGNAFAALSTLLDSESVTIYAYDQRGFGATDGQGIWPGGDTLVGDLRTLATLLRGRHPDLPLYLVAESMGGAVALRAITEAPGLDIDGVILLAPAVWGARVMPWYQRLGLWLLLRIAPGAMFSGDAVAHLGIRMTDDPDVLEALRNDPLVQSRARVDTLHGLTSLMGEALDHPPGFAQPTLVLYGLNDQVVPPSAVCAWFEHLLKLGAEQPRIVLYPEGFHLLTRYRQAANTGADIAAWLDDPGSERIVGEVVSVEEGKARVCGLPSPTRGSGERGK